MEPPPHLVIEKRQKFARKLGDRIKEIVSQSENLSSLVQLIIWHGSLPQGRGGYRYDIDLGIFLNVDLPRELLDGAQVWLSNIDSLCSFVESRNDLHYDGMRMFEAHAHLDPTIDDMHHVGVHFYRREALQEIFGDQSWGEHAEPSNHFYYHYDLWVRYNFFYRHWIEEGKPIYDPKKIYSEARELNCVPSIWIKKSLREVLVCCLQGYMSGPNGKCTVDDSREQAFFLVAGMAYMIEGTAMGRSNRYADDLLHFKDDSARALLGAVVARDIMQAANLVSKLEEQETFG